MFTLDVPLANAEASPITISTTPGFPFRIRLIRGKREVN